MAWITFTSVSVSNGGLTATVNSSEDISLLEINAGLIIGELAPVAIKKAYLGAGNSKVIELFAPWPHATQTNKAARVFNTDAGLPEATKALNDVTDLVKGDFSEVIVVADNIDKVVNVSDNMSAVIAAPAEAAKAKTEADRAATNALSMTSMSQSQFEAIRAANNEEFAASGFVHMGKHIVSVKRNNVNDGLWTIEDMPNRLLLGYASSFAVGASKAKLPTANIAGVQFNVANVNDSGDANTIKFPQAPDGKTTYNKSTGAIVTHATVAAAFAAQQADPTNVEVVIDRVDMWGFEAWLEEVNPTNPFVYPNGLIQSQATTMDGITTSASARPVTYYAVFDGDTGSKGKGVNFFTLTDAQKKKVLGNHKNNLYYLDDGRLVQWRLRQRTIAGAGNGDWNQINSIGENALFAASTNTRLLAQGIMDAGNSIGNDGIGISYLGTASSGKTKNQDSGIFSGRHSSLSAIEGECYFLVCGTVNRLNQGAYHPSFNPSGSRLASGGNLWYTAAGLASLTSTVSCFTEYHIGSGNIDSSYSGRQDNRFYDAIYADGQGGVCRDMRYSANGLTPTDFAEADQRVKNGTYRGFEKAVFTKLVNVVAGNLNGEGYVSGINGTGSSGHITNYGGTALPIFRQNSYLFEPITKTLCKTSGLDTDKGEITIAISAITGVVENLRYPAKLIHIIVDRAKSSIGGSFLQTDVIGSPSNILATPQLANGWQGSWIPVIPDETSKRYTMLRKNIGPYLNNVVHTDSNGAYWASMQFGIEATTNDFTLSMPASRVLLIQYQAFAKQTENAVNTTVYGGVNGIGSVATVRVNDIKEGSLLQESLIGKVNTDAAAWITSVNLISIGLSAKDHLVPVAGYCSKHPASMFEDLAPINNSPAVKALNYNVNVNQQAFIQYAYTELRHNGTNWGDDGKVTIVDNQSTKTDLNGNTVLVGTAQTCESLGWIKNKV